jgi:hypothetical protein
MSVRIELDNSAGSVFTCLDVISGKVTSSTNRLPDKAEQDNQVVMNIPSEETISSITVKLEGISRTRLEHPRLEVPGERVREKRRAEVEIHRVRTPPDPVPLD